MIDIKIIIIVSLVIFAIFVLLYKKPVKKPLVKKQVKPILKNAHQSIDSKKNVKFYDVRMSQLSNDIETTKNQTPTDELLDMWLKNNHLLLMLSRVCIKLLYTFNTPSSPTRPIYPRWGAWRPA